MDIKSTIDGDYDDDDSNDAVMPLTMRNWRFG